MKLLIKKGATSYLASVFIQDSSSATGAGLTGLLFNSSSLTGYYSRSDDGNNGGNSITLATATRGTWSSGGFKEKDSTNMPGVYELGIPNAALASGSNWVIIYLKGATNMAPCVLEAQLVDWDPQSATLGISYPTNFSSLSIDSNGNVATTANVKKNTASSGFMFVMTDSSTHAPKTGLTVTAQRSIDGASFASCSNSVSEVGNGTYTINLSAGDVNGNHIMLRFTASGADDLNIEIVTQP